MTLGLGLDSADRSIVQSPHRLSDICSTLFSCTRNVVAVKMEITHRPCRNVTNDVAVYARQASSRPKSRLLPNIPYLMNMYLSKMHL